MEETKKTSVWEKLVREEILSEEQFLLAKKQSEETKESLQKVIIKLGILTERELLGVLSEYYSVPIMDLSTCNIKKPVLDLIPKAIVTKYLMIPVYKIGNTLTLATSDPLNFYGLDHVQRHTQLNVKTVLSTESSVLQAIERYYGSVEGGATTIQRIELSGKLSDSSSEWQDDAPIVNLVNNIMEQAVDGNASDIHIEPEEKFVRIRIRIDGILYEVSTPPKEIESGIISRIKIMSGMNIAERRKPQDGRCKVNIKGREIDFRISTIPTNFGENMVIRLLDKSQLILPLEKLGLNQQTETKWKEMIQKPYGIILVTGPTGSGKTTTLYSTINRLKSISTNIMTLEDPIEYQMEMIRQAQVNPKMDISFALGLRAILRQDPDIIMLGEIRDLDTAEIAIQAALTGHLVFSTLHTNDASSALTRLAEMGIEPYLLATSVIGILAQRLVRIACPACSQKRNTTEEDARILGIPWEAIHDKSIPVPIGCKKCKNKGYTGRIGIFELLSMTPEIKKRVLSKGSGEEIKEVSIQDGMQTLYENGVEKLFAQTTTLEELLRVCTR